MGIHVWMIHCARCHNSDYIIVSSIIKLYPAVSSWFLSCCMHARPNAALPRFLPTSYTSQYQRAYEASTFVALLYLLFWFNIIARLCYLLCSVSRLDFQQSTNTSALPLLWCPPRLNILLRRYRYVPVLYSTLHLIFSIYSHFLWLLHYIVYLHIYAYIYATSQLFWLYYELLPAPCYLPTVVRVWPSFSFAIVLPFLIRY